MTATARITPLPADALSAAEAAVRAIPPVWPLASSVAVNPFLGQSDERLSMVGARLGRVAGIRVTMARDWYAARIEDGTITDDDLAAALAAAPADRRPGSVARLRDAAAVPSPERHRVPTVADLAAQATGTDWPGLIAERIGAFAASTFDEGQALWAAPRGRSAYDAWRAVASRDLTPEIMGLRGFAQHVADAPEHAPEAIERAVARLGLGEAARESYFHALLMTLGGWSQVARHRLWTAELAGGSDATAVDLLAIRLVWEEALHDLCRDDLASAWAQAIVTHGDPLVPDDDLIVDEILQEAAERAAQRRLAEVIEAPGPERTDDRPALQAAFCIDVRSEVFRRALEAVDPGIRTLGFAGFFGIGTAHRGFASDVEERRLPVLLNPGLRSHSGGPADAERDREERLSRRAVRAWGRFKQAAVSSFAFVEATGPVHAATLVRDAFGLKTRPAPDEPAPQLDPAPDLAGRIDAAETVLRAMSLTAGFARLVLVTGHGANVANNPHESALDCGACGGFSGEVNARLLAGLLNDPGVRTGLEERGIRIPADTAFVGALHDTTTDAVTIYDTDQPLTGHRADLVQARAWLEAAGVAARAERALRLPRADSGTGVAARSRDWAETRPEWALAGCQALIAAPRHRTAGKGLAGRAFLHDYDWRADGDFAVLELIITAPVVVASWIGLQYYGSTVAPQAFGGGNKLLHNVTGGIGVVEGNGGLLRPGLPWQSVHDGEALAHEPLRLCICIEAPCQAMTGILRRHSGVRALFDNRWLHLVALDDAGRMAWRYAGDLVWEPNGAGHAGDAADRSEPADGPGRIAAADTVAL